MFAANSSQNSRLVSPALQALEGLIYTFEQTSITPDAVAKTNFNVLHGEILQKLQAIRVAMIQQQTASEINFAGLNVEINSLRQSLNNSMAQQIHGIQIQRAQQNEIADLQLKLETWVLSYQELSAENALQKLLTYTAEQRALTAEARVVALENALQAANKQAVRTAVMGEGQLNVYARFLSSKPVENLTLPQTTGFYQQFPEQVSNSTKLRKMNSFGLPPAENTFIHPSDLACANSSSNDTAVVLSP